MAQEMQRVRYFRMVQEKIHRNTTFLMPSDRLLSRPSLRARCCEFLSRHSITVHLMFNDLIRLPNGTIVPTHHSGDTITVTNIKHQKFYFNGIKLTSPDLCHLRELFRCHGINGIIKQTATRRAKAATCRSNFCSTREDIDPKPILEDIFSTISQHRFFHDPCSRTCSRKPSKFTHFCVKNWIG